jgi:hypothetical protein
MSRCGAQISPFGADGRQPGIAGPACGGLTSWSSGLDEHLVVCGNSGALCVLFTDFNVLSAPRGSGQCSGNSVAGRPSRQFDARVRIEQFEPGNDAGRLKACHDIVLAGARIDHPSLPAWPLRSFRAKWTRSYDSAPGEAWLATDDSGEPAGCYLLRLLVKENVTLAGVILQVPPARRRAGTARSSRKIRNIRNDSRLSVETGRRNAMGLTEYRFAPAFPIRTRRTLGSPPVSCSRFATLTSLRDLSSRHRQSPPGVPGPGSPGDLELLTAVPR